MSKRPLAASKTGICLNMIVKNETKVLDRLFRSIQGFIDYYVIVDTGSTDGTPAFIRDWMGKAGIEGEVHERKWVNFGANRQQALELAVQADRSDWLLFIDADEELVVTDAEGILNLEAGVNYGIDKLHGLIRYQLPALINIRSTSWRWCAPVHEYLESTSGPAEVVPLKGVHILFHEGEGARSVGLTAEQKFLGDARLLEQHLRKSPKDSRSQFYVANSYRDAGHLEKAFKAYRKRAAMPGFDEETFMAQFEVGRIAIALKRNEGFIVTELLKAFELRPCRAEPLHTLARYFRERERYGSAYVYAKAGSAIKMPPDILFVAHEVYRWRLLDELGVAAYWIGHHHESKACIEEILHKHREGLFIPEADMARLQKNLAFANAGLADVDTA